MAANRQARLDGCCWSRADDSKQPLGRSPWMPEKTRTESCSGDGKTVVATLRLSTSRPAGACCVGKCVPTSAARSLRHHEMQNAKSGSSAARGLGETRLFDARWSPIRPRAANTRLVLVAGQLLMRPARTHRPSRGQLHRSPGGLPRLANSRLEHVQRLLHVSARRPLPPEVRALRRSSARPLPVRLR